MNALSAFDVQYRDELKNYFIGKVQGLCNDGIEVQYNMAYVSKYRTAENWDELTIDRIMEIEDHILPMLPSSDDPAKVKSFDIIIYAIEAEYNERISQGKDPRKIRHGFYGVDRELTDRMEELRKLKTIPDVLKKEKLIESMRHGDYLLDNFSLERAEYVRKELRDLMSYIPDKPSYYIINVADWISDDGDGGGTDIAKPQKTYAEKAREYIDKDSPALAKLRNLDDLTEAEKTQLKDVFTSQLGSQADYAAWSGNTPLLPYLRTRTGINESAVQTKFGSFLNGSVLNSTQLEFMKQIIDYARTNGDITAADLMKVSPFCDTDIMGLFGADKFPYVKQLINGLHKPVM
jgi:type I restriction enzyme R subunit